MIIMSVEEAQQIVEENKKLTRLEVVDPNVPDCEKQYAHIRNVSRKRYLKALQVLAGAAFMPPPGS